MDQVFPSPLLDLHLSLRVDGVVLGHSREKDGWEGKPSNLPSPKFPDVSRDIEAHSIASIRRTSLLRKLVSSPLLDARLQKRSRQLEREHLDDALSKSFLGKQISCRTRR